MIFLTESWFEYAGIKSTDMHIRLVEMPVRQRSAARGEWLTASGADGDLWAAENANDAYDTEIICETADGCDEAALRAWLVGSGDLVISDEPDRVLRVSIYDGIDFPNKFQNFDRKAFTVPIRVQPYRYHHPPAAPFAVASGEYITNPGTAASRPKITVTGSGTVVVGINAVDITVADVSGGCVIDCAAQDVFNAEENALLNQYTQIDGDEFPVLTPGPNLITYSGSISQITIEPRWRDL